MKRLSFVLWLAITLAISACSQAGEPTEATRPVEAPATVVVTEEVTRQVEVTREIEVTREVTRIVEVEKVVTATPEPTPTEVPVDETGTVPTDDGRFALNYVARAESGGIVVDVARILVETKEQAEQSSGNDFDQITAFQDIEIVGMIVISMTNTTDQMLNVYPDQGSIQIGSEQIELFDYFLGGFGDDLGGEFYPGVTKIGGQWFGIKRSQPADINSMIFRFSAPTTESFDRVGPPFEILIEIGEQVWQPLPDELK